MGFTDLGKSWYLLGPVTRFKAIGQSVEYEVAQQPISASRVSGDTPFPGPDEIEVICMNTVWALLLCIWITGATIN